MHVGHSTGGGEVVRYVARHGTKRVAKVVLVRAVPPFMLKTGDNPEGVPMEVFDGIRAGVARRSFAVLAGLRVAVLRRQPPGAKISQGVRDAFWRLSMQAGHAPPSSASRRFRQTDFRADLAKIDVPTLIIHGDDDQVVPIEVGGAGPPSGSWLPADRLSRRPHGITDTHKEQLGTDLLAFLNTSEKGYQPMTTPDTVVLIHGLWMTPRSWKSWDPYYEAKGYRSHPRLPGFEIEVEALRENPDLIANLTVQQDD